MKKLLEKNINTKSYWNRTYKKGLESKIWPKDIFKFENIAGHIVNGTSVVDLGCGTGELCRVIKNENQFCNVIGVDFSEEAIRKAKKIRSEVFYKIAEVTDTKLEKNSFDYVVSSETLEHLDWPEDLFKEASRILKVGGRLILTTPFLDHIPSKEHLWGFDFTDIEEMVKKYFRQYWVFPWASGRSEVVETETKRLIYLKGNWDTIMVLAIK